MHYRSVRIICALLVLMAIVMGASAAEWTQFQSDTQNTGTTDDSGPITTPNATPSWSVYTVGGGWSGLDAAPVVGDGKVYEVAYNGNVYAKYLNGTSAWTNTAIGGDGYFELATPAYYDERLYVALSRGNASTQTTIHAINTNTGNAVWSNTNLGNQQTNTPVLYDDGLVYFGTVNMASVNESDKGTYYAVYADNGSVCWSRNSTTGAGYYWAGAAVIGDYLVYGDDGGNVTSVDKKTGALVDDIDIADVWSGTSGLGKIRSSCCYDDATDTVYFTSSGGYCLAIGFNENSGTFNRNDTDISADLGTSTSTPAVYGNRLYVGSSGGLYCLNKADLDDTIWSHNPGGAVQASPAVSTFYDNGTSKEVYVYYTTNCANGKLYCMKDYSGNNAADLQFSYDPSPNQQYILQGAAVSGGWVFFGNDAGYLFGLSNQTRYDFNTKSAAAGDADACGDVVMSLPTNATTPSAEFSDAEYAAIKADDGTTADSTSANDGEYAAQRFRFKVQSDEEDWISGLDVTWVGTGTHDSSTATKGADLYIWNGTAYVSLDSTTSGSEDTLTGSVASDIGNYIDDSGYVTLLVKQKSAQTTGRETYRSYLETDYVSVEAVH